MSLLRRWLEMARADIALWEGYVAPGGSQATGGLVGMLQITHETTRCSKNAGSSTSNEAERYRREEGNLRLKR